MKHLSNDKIEEFSTKEDWYKLHREKSFQKMLQSELPSFRYGLAIFLRPDFDFETLQPGSKNTNIVVNFEKESNIEVLSSDNISDNRLKDFIGEQWEFEDNHQLYYFHQAFANDCLFIRIPKGASLKKPIEILYDVEKGNLISSIFILAEKNCSAKIHLLKTGAQANSYISDDVRILADSGSKIDFISIQDLNKKSITVQKRTSQIKNDAEVNWIDTCLGTKYSKSNVVSLLNKEGANGNIKVLFSGSGKQRYDIYTASVHNSKNTYSDIVTKGVLNKQAKGLSRGLVKINENASGSNGYETQDVLLLSTEAEADAIPNLEIHNHDVKCSHGSTIGQVDKEKLFYLMSRGLDEDTAKVKLVEGYFTPVLDLFTDENTKIKIRDSILQSVTR